MKKLISISFILALAIFAVAETVIRVFFQSSMDGRFEYGYNPTSGFVENADGTVDLIRTGGRRFRPQSFTKEPSADTYRVMVIGDSVPRGPSLEEAYPRLVQDILGSKGVKAECFNLGVAGYGAARKDIVLRKTVDYRPDLIILHINDSNEYEDEREFRRSNEFKGWHPKNWGMKSLVVRRLYEAKTERIFWKLLPTTVRNQKAINDADAEIAESQSPEKLREWAERVRKYTAGSVAFAHARGVPVLIVVQAIQKDKNVPKLDDNGVGAMAGTLAGDGVYVLSMKDVLEPLHSPELYADGSHLHAEGHKVLAGAIVKLLVREHLVPKGHGRNVADAGGVAVR